MTPTVDGLLLRRIKTFLQILLRSQNGFLSSTTTFALLAFLVEIADQIATYYTGILPSKFFVALGGRDASAFKRLLWESALIVFAKSLILAASKYATSCLYIKCRRVCNSALHYLYFRNLAFQKVDVSQECDNPDQRMTQDIEKLTRILTQHLFTPVLMAPFIIGYYTYLTFKRAGWLGPLAIYGYFLVSTFVNKLLLSPIVSLVNEQEKKEGDFRAKHLEIRANVEAIAFFDAGRTERLMTDAKLDELLSAQKRLVNWRTLLCLLTNFFNYYGATLSYLLIAVPIFLTHRLDDYSGVELTGIISENAFVYLYLVYSFSNIISLTELFGDMSAVAHRVIGLYEKLENFNADNGESKSETGDDDMTVIVAKNRIRKSEWRSSKTYEELKLVAEAGENESCVKDESDGQLDQAKQ